MILKSLVLRNATWYFGEIIEIDNQIETSAHDTTLSVCLIGNWISTI